MYIPWKYYWGSLCLDENAIEGVRTYSRFYSGIVNFLLFCLLFSLPLTKEEVYSFPIEFGVFAIKMMVLIIAIWFIVRLLGGMGFVKLFYTISTVYFFAGIPLAIVSYIVLFIFEYLLNNAVVSGLLLSIIPFYLFLLFAFSAEKGSGLEGWKEIVVGLISLILVFVVYYYL